MQMNNPKTNFYSILNSLSFQHQFASDPARPSQVLEDLLCFHRTTAIVESLGVRFEPSRCNIGTVVMTMSDGLILVMLHSAILSSRIALQCRLAGGLGLELRLVYDLWRASSFPSSVADFDWRHLSWPVHAAGLAPGRMWASVPRRSLGFISCSLQ